MRFSFYPFQHTRTSVFFYDLVFSASLRLLNIERFFGGRFTQSIWQQGKLRSILFNYLDLEFFKNIPNIRFIASRSRTPDQIYTRFRNVIDRCVNLFLNITLISIGYLCFPIEVTLS